MVSTSRPKVRMFGICFIMAISVAARRHNSRQNLVWRDSRGFSVKDDRKNGPVA